MSEKKDGGSDVVTDMTKTARPIWYGVAALGLVLMIVSRIHSCQQQNLQAQQAGSNPRANAASVPNTRASALPTAPVAVQNESLAPLPAACPSVKRSSISYCSPKKGATSQDLMFEFSGDQICFTQYVTATDPITFSYVSRDSPEPIKWAGRVPSGITLEHSRFTANSDGASIGYWSTPQDSSCADSYKAMHFN